MKSFNPGRFLYAAILKTVLQCGDCKTTWVDFYHSTIPIGTYGKRLFICLNESETNFMNITRTRQGNRKGNKT